MPGFAQPDRSAVGERSRLRLAGRVLLHGDERPACRCPPRRCAARGGRDPSARSSSRRRPGGGTTVPKWIENPWANISMSPSFRFGAMSRLVDRRVGRVGQQAHHDVGLGDRIGGVEDAQPRLLGLRAARRTGRAARPERRAPSPGGSERARVPASRTRGPRSSGRARTPGPCLPRSRSSPSWFVPSWPRGRCLIWRARRRRLQRAFADASRSPRASAIRPVRESSTTPKSLEQPAERLELLGLAGRLDGQRSSASRRRCPRGTRRRSPSRGPARRRSARTFTSISSRSTAVPGSCSRILITLISLLSCFVTCSSGFDSTFDDDRHPRQPVGSRSEPTASESML